MAQMIELAGEIKDLSYYQSNGKNGQRPVKAVMFDAGDVIAWVPAQFAKPLDGSDFTIGDKGIMCAEWIARDRGFI